MKKTFTIKKVLLLGSGALKIGESRPARRNNFFKIVL